MVCWWLWAARDAERKWLYRMCCTSYLSGSEDKRNVKYKPFLTKDEI